MPAPWAAVAEGRIVGTLHGQETINVFHFATNTVVSDPGALDELLLRIAQALLECAVETLLPGVTSDYTLVSADAKRLYPAVSDPLIATADAGAVGELGATSVSFAASLMNIRTGGGGRRGRGKKFLPPPGELNVTASDIDGPTLALLVQFGICLAGKFMGAAPETEWHLGVLSKTTLKAAGGTYDTAFRVATQLSPVQEMACLRSRRKGHGA